MSCLGFISLVEIALLVDSKLMWSCCYLVSLCLNQSGEFSILHLQLKHTKPAVVFWWVIVPNFNLQAVGIHVRESFLLSSGLCGTYSRSSYPLISFCYKLFFLNFSITECILTNPFIKPELQHSLDWAKISSAVRVELFRCFCPCQYSELTLPACTLN